ncbi:MAG: Uncharacterised protein [Bacteroidota bacterium]|nr:MAG: Uncharacterised protein [Bacteroidota bacterium]
MIKVNYTYRILILGLSLFSSAITYAQTSFPVSPSIVQKINPSIHGLNLNSKAGVMFSSINYGDGLSAENNYLYGNMAFRDLNFSIGVDVNSFSLNQLGLKENSMRLSYAYNFRIGVDTYFIGGLDLGVTAQVLDPNALIFGDQINEQLGTIVGSSIDPLATIKPSTNYFEIGASGVVYNEKFMAGIHLAHLNSPNISFNKETVVEKEMAVILNGAVELDVNPYGRGILPQNSYFFGSFYGILHGETTRILASQELQMNNLSLGIMQSMISFGENSAMEMGLLTTISFDNFLFKFNYTFASKSDEFNAPSIVELGLRFNFDRFSRNSRGYYKRLSTNNL